MMNSKLGMSPVGAWGCMTPSHLLEQNLQREWQGYGRAHH